MTPRFTARGRHRIAVINPDGHTVRSVNVPNLLVNGFFESLMDLSTDSLATQIGVGSGTSPAVLADTNLQTPLGDPVAGLLTVPSPLGSDHAASVGQEQYVVSSTWLPGTFEGTSTTITEVGVYNTDGALVSRTVLPSPLVLDVKQTLVITYTLTFTYPTSYSGTLSLGTGDPPYTATLYLLRPFLALTSPFDEFQGAATIVQGGDPYNPNWRVGLGAEYDAADFINVHNATASHTDDAAASTVMAIDPPMIRLQGDLTNLIGTPGTFRHLLLADATDMTAGLKIPGNLYAVLDLGAEHPIGALSKFSFLFQLTW